MRTKRDRGLLLSVGERELGFAARRPFTHFCAASSLPLPPCYQQVAPTPGGKAGWAGWQARPPSEKGSNTRARRDGQTLASEAPPPTFFPRQPDWLHSRRVAPFTARGRRFKRRERRWTVEVVRSPRCTSAGPQGCWGGGAAGGANIPAKAGHKKRRKCEGGEAPGQALGSCLPPSPPITTPAGLFRPPPRRRLCYPGVALPDPFRLPRLEPEPPPAFPSCFPVSRLGSAPALTSRPFPPFHRGCFQQLYTLSQRRLCPP